ncbi:MAG: hypothetical protein ABIN18_07145, partial [Pseudomonadota bacterium]
VQTIKKNCPDWIGITVRNESESVSGMDRNHCPKIIGMGVRNGSEYAIALDSFSERLICHTILSSHK